MYPPEMQESVDNVIATRERRLEESYPVLSAEEKATLLQGFHPDSIADGMRELQIGPNKGERTPNELADLLEGNSRIDPDIIDLDTVDYDVDVLVIGVVEGAPLQPSSRRRMMPA